MDRHIPEELDHRSVDVHGIDTNTSVGRIAVAMLQSSIGDTNTSVGRIDVATPLCGVGDTKVKIKNQKI